MEPGGGAAACSATLTETYGFASCTKAMQLLVRKASFFSPLDAFKAGSLVSSQTLLQKQTQNKCVMKNSAGEMETAVKKKRWCGQRRERGPE